MATVITMPMANTFGCNVIVPLDTPGISRGKALRKIGKRPLPQGEIYFDNVRLPRRFAVATRDDYDLKHAMAWAHAGTAMSHISAGLARAAFEHALSYANQRARAVRSWVICSSLSIDSA